MLFRTFSAETFKLRRTPALLLALGIPLLLCLFSLIALTVSENLRLQEPAQKWGILLSLAGGIWPSTMLPLGVAILTGLTVGLETGDNQWKHILVLPPARGQVYLAKVLTLLGLLTLGSGVLVLGLVLVGVLTAGGTNIPWQSLFSQVFLAGLGALPLLSLNLWLSSRFRSFALPLGLALVGTVAGNIASNSREFWTYIQWTYPQIILREASQIQALGLSLGLFALFLILGLWDFAKRDMQ